MKSANPFSEYDLLPLGMKNKTKKKAQDGTEIPKPKNKPVPLFEIDRPEVNLNLKRSSAHETIHAMLEKKKPRPDNRELFEGLYSGLVAFDNFLPEDKINSPVVYPLESYQPAQYGRGSQAIAKNGGVISGLSGTMYSRNAYKSKTKVSNKMIADYGMEIGEEDDPKKPKLKPVQGVYTSYDQINADNRFTRDFLERHNDPNASQMVVARNIGDPKMKFVGDKPNVKTNLPTKLPSGINIKDVFQTSEGLYGYQDPHEDRFIQVDGSVYAAAQNQTKVKDVAKLKLGGRLSKKKPNKNDGLISYYEQGSSHEMSNDQIKHLLSQGYELEID